MKKYILIFYSVLFSSAAYSMQTPVHLPSFDSKESNKVRRMVMVREPRPSLPNLSLSTTMAQEETNSSESWKIIQQYKKQPALYTDLEPYLALVQHKDIQQVQATLNRQSLPQLYALAEHANYLDIPSLLEPTLTAISSRLLEPQHAKAVLKGDAAITLTPDLRHTLTPKILGITAKIQWLLKEKRHSTSNSKIPFKEYRSPNYIQSLETNAAGTLLAVLHDRALSFYNFDTLKRYRRIVLEEDTEDSLPAFFNDCKFRPTTAHQLVSADDGGALKLWDIAQKKTIRTWQFEPSDFPDQLCFNPDGNTFISVSNKQDTLQLWDVRTDACIRSQENTLKGYTVNIAAQPHGNHFAIASWMNGITLWDPSLSSCTTTLRRTAPVIRWTKGIQFHPTETQLVESMSNYIGFWDYTTGKLIREITLNADQHHIISSYQCSLNPRIPSIAAVRNNREGKFTLELWNVDKGSYITTLHENLFNNDGLVFHPSGRSLATVGACHSIKVWDLFNEDTQEYFNTLGSPEEALLLTRVARFRSLEVKESLMHQLPESLQETVVEHSKEVTIIPDAPPAKRHKR